MDQQLIDYSEEILHIFRAIAKQFRNKFMKEGLAEEFTVPQLMLLHELYHYPNISLKELSSRLYLSKSTVSAMVDRLEKSGYLTREIPEENRRMVRISLSEKCLGKSELLDIKLKYTREIVERLGVEETVKVIEALKKLRDATIE